MQKYPQSSTFWLVVFCQFFLAKGQGPADQNCGAITTCAEIVNNVTQTVPNYEGYTTPQLIQLYGYPVETHHIITADGYILTSFRIPYSNISLQSSGKTPVFLQHGILASSAQWMWQPTTRGLAFMLADAGYDVWLGNARGTSYSQGHVSLNTSDLTYWNFSEFEMGKYDIPAVLNYITNATGQPSIHYIGHSLGTTQFFIALLLNPGLSSKVKVHFALAPVAYNGKDTNPLFRGAAPLYSQFIVEKQACQYGGGIFLPSFLQRFMGNLQAYCTFEAVTCGLCYNFYNLVFGLDVCQTNFTLLPGFLAHLPDVISTKTFSHQMQSVQFGTFQQYDYGIISNMNAYGSLTPPQYNWTNYNVPTVFFSGLADNLATPPDVNKTGIALGVNLVENNINPLPYWQHLDPIIGIDADIYVYNRIIQIMNQNLYATN